MLFICFSMSKCAVTLFIARGIAMGEGAYGAAPPPSRLVVDVRGTILCTLLLHPCYPSCRDTRPLQRCTHRHKNNKEARPNTECTFCFFRSTMCPNVIHIHSKCKASLLTLYKGLKVESRDIHMHGDSHVKNQVVASRPTRLPYK